VAGGPVEYAANLFSQTYSRRWLGTLAFALLASAAWAVARGVARRFAPRAGGWAAWVFPLLILILVNRHISVLYVIPMLGGLAAAWLYMGLSGPRWASILFLLASVPVYHLLASGLLYFCAMCALFEALIRRRPVWALAWIVSAAAAPFGLSWICFEPANAARYLRWIRLPQYDALTNGTLVALYLLVPAAAVIAFMGDRLGVRDHFRPGVQRAWSALGFVALIVLAGRLAALRFDQSGWLYADYLVDAEMAEGALASLAQPRDDGDAARFLTFYALARARRLTGEMFRYPQSPSSDALLFRDARFDTVPGIADWRSDVYLELGRINDSMRWAHEALTVEGETPRVLERMALVYILNDNPDAARTFLHALEKVPFQAERARRTLSALDLDPAMRSDPLVARIRPLALRQDYVGTWTTEQILAQCLEANPSNRMAFEYLLVHYLLTSDMEGFAKLAPRLKDFYRVLPAHVEEALISYRNVNGALPAGVDPRAIDRRTESRFQRFLEIYLRLQSTPDSARKALAPAYGGTYWFFCLFGETEGAA
jgi:hypothetical protein